MSPNLEPAAREGDERRWHTHRRYLYILAKLALATLAVVVAWRVLSVLSVVLMPALVGLVLAYVFDPLIDLFERRGVGRTAVIGALALVLLLSLGALAFVVVPAFVQQFARTMQRLPEWLESVYQSGAHLARERLGYSGAEIEAATRKAFASAQGALLAVLTSLTGPVNALLNTLLIPLFFFYFLRDFDRMKLQPLALVPPRLHDYVISRARTMDRVVGGWIRGQVQVALILAALYAVGLTASGVRLGLVIGIVAGLLSVVPYFGAGVGIALSVLMVLIEHPAWGSLLAVAGVFLVVQVLEGYVLTPRLVGAKVGMHPLVVVVVVLVGGSLFGLVGMLVAVPVTAALGVLVQDFLQAYRRSAWWTGAVTADADPGAPGGSASALAAEPAAKR